MTRRLLAALALLALWAQPVHAARAASTKGAKALDKTISAGGLFGLPAYTTAALPTCTPLLAQSAPVAYDTTTSTVKLCDGSTWVTTAFGGGGITAGTSTFTGFVDGDILYNNGGVAGGFGIYDDTGAGNGAFALRKTMSGSSATSNFFSVTGTAPATLSAATYGVRIDFTPDNDAQAQSALYVAMGNVNGGGTDPWALRVSNLASTNGIFCADDNGTCKVTIVDGALTASFGTNGLSVGALSSGSAGYLIYAESAAATGIKASTSSTTSFSEVLATNTTGTVLNDLAAWNTAAAGTFLGAAKAGLGGIIASGTSLTGLAVGPTTDDPLYLGRNDEQRYQIGPQKTLVDNTITTFARETLGNDTGGGGSFHYCVYAADATTAAQECGNVDFGGIDVTAGAGGEVCTITKVGTPVQTLSGATLTVTFAGLAGTDVCDFRVTADPNIATPVSLWIKWNLNHSGRVVAAQ